MKLRFIFSSFISQGKRKCVQTAVEEPHQYLLARCPASIEQLAYSEVRLEDMIEWNHSETECNGIKFVDNIRFFKGIISRYV